MKSKLCFELDHATNAVSLKLGAYGENLVENWTKNY